MFLKRVCYGRRNCLSLPDKGGKVMPEIKKFESEKVSAALKLLRALPEKDNRKSLNEALLMLSGGIQAAIGKGYSRREIRNTLAKAGVVLSTTSLNNFLNGSQENIPHEKNQEATVQQEPNSVETQMGRQVNTKRMDGGQQNAIPENSKESPARQKL
jgi:hypothetical protein